MVAFDCSLETPVQTKKTKSVWRSMPLSAFNHFMCKSPVHLTDCELRKSAAAMWHVNDVPPGKQCEHLHQEYGTYCRWDQGAS